MALGGIDTAPRIAAFLGQLLHETAGFQFLVELASGQAYEGRLDLGNVQPGDGPRYKGRGFIHLTGRANYREAGDALDLPLEERPELAERPDIAARVAVWFWNKKRLSPKADAGDIVAITRAINGGTNGLAERQRLTESALRVLGQQQLV
jgi:putative chitinase